MKRKKIHIGLLMIVFFLLWITYTIWPLWSFFSPHFLAEKHLIIVTNEAEQRPCGGFITTYGELSFVPPKLTFKNAYSLNKPVNSVLPSTLKKVTNAMHFWDLAYEKDINICTQNIQKAYQEITNKTINRVWLVNTEVFTDLLRIIEPIKVDEYVITSQNFFPDFSRKVANVDRHDETALIERKNPLKIVIKAFAKKAITSPHAWKKLLKVLTQAEQNSKIFIQNHSKNLRPNSNQIQITEWNLGGGKTSQGLWSELTINAREIQPQEWAIDLDLEIQNLTGNDEPLGQNWQGQWEMILPLAWKQPPSQVELSIAAGESWKWQKKISYNGNINELDIFVPRGQNLRAELKISTYPQQILISNQLETFNNIGIWQGLLQYGNNKFNWTSNTDIEPPFLTMHKPINKKLLPKEIQQKFTENDLVIEVHTNEKIIPEQVKSAQLIDRDYAIKNITENVTTNKILVLENQTTILLGFNPKNSQINERFNLEIKTLKDKWGNILRVNQNTVIIRK